MSSKEYARNRNKNNSNVVMFSWHNKLVHKVLLPNFPSSFEANVLRVCINIRIIFLKNVNLRRNIILNK